MAVHAAKEILGISDVKGDEIQEILEKGFGGNPNMGKCIELVKLGFMKRSLFSLVLYGFPLKCICNVNEMIKHSSVQLVAVMHLLLGFQPPINTKKKKKKKKKKSSVCAVLVLFC